jgi:hypothetical protein
MEVVSAAYFLANGDITCFTDLLLRAPSMAKVADVE